MVDYAADVVNSQDEGALGYDTNARGRYLLHDSKALRVWVTSLRARATGGADQLTVGRHRMVLMLGSALLATMALLSGCSKSPSDSNPAIQTIDAGHPERGKMDPSLTEPIARDRINTFLLESLQGLPPGVGYSINSDNHYLGTMHTPSLVVPCTDNGSTGQLTITYWVVGVPAGQNAQYFELIRNTWTGRGWTLQKDADSHWAPIHTPDGYGIVLQYAPTQDQSLSISVGSPCFPWPEEHTTTPPPPEVKRPS